MAKRVTLFILTTIIFLGSSQLCFADLGKAAQSRDPANAAVVSVIEKIGNLQISQEEFLAVLKQFDNGKEECQKVDGAPQKAACMEEVQKLLERAKKLFQSLNEQALSIEAEIAQVRHDLSKRHLDKLERILAEVTAMRNFAAAEMSARRL